MSVSKGELPKLSQPHHPAVILGHFIISPPQSPKLDASPPAQSHYCNAIRTPRAQVCCISSLLTSKGYPQSPWHFTLITIHFDATVLPQPIRFYLFDLVKMRSVQFTTYPPTFLVSLWPKQHLSFPIYLVFMQKTYLSKQIHKVSEITDPVDSVLYY